MENIVKLSKKNSTGKLKNLFWQAHRAVNEGEFDIIMSNINNLNPTAAKYLQDIPVIQWAMWPMIRDKIQLLKTSTSNDVEQEMQRFKREKIRANLPYHVFLNIAQLWSRLIRESTKTTEFQLSSRQPITPFARSELSEKILQSRRFDVSHLSHNVVSKNVNAEERRLFGVSHSKMSGVHRKEDVSFT
jgi:hypothetical protein